MVFDEDDRILDWLDAALPACRSAVADPANGQWFRHGDTWFVGVNALNNDERGAVPGGPPIDGPFRSVVEDAMGMRNVGWDRAQVSVCYPGYPQFSGDEPEAAHRYRIKRSAAHIDGLNRVGPERRRHLLECHAFILGIAMVEFSADASPFVVWEGSHKVAREVFEQVYGDHEVADWSSIDITGTYQDLRREIFNRIEPQSIALRPGQCFLAHRHVLHGMAPWGDGARATDDGRMICYFRPEFRDQRRWLDAP